MKKIILAAVAGIMVSTTAMADIAISWYGDTGFYNWNAPVSPTDPDYINFGGGSATAYLIWSPDATIDPVNSANTGLVSGNDVVIDSLTVNNAPYGDYANGPEVYVGAYQNAFVYIRIVDTTGPSGSTQYYNSTTLATVAYDPLNPVVQFQNNNSVAGAGSGLGDRMVLVPEPATFAFMGIGGLLLALRRMRRS